MPSSRPIDTLFIELRATGDKLAGDVSRSLKTMDRGLSRAGDKLQATGTSLTRRVTAPVLAFGAAVVNSAKKFESAMNRVEANAQASTDQIEKLRQKALELGRDPELFATALDAGEAMDVLAKNGLKASQLIDSNVTKSMLTLARATGGTFNRAADIATDAVAQFSLELGDMDSVANQITGVLINSKTRLDDYRLALSQAGGVAGIAANVSFKDFNTVIANSAKLFSGGSDAGTSFKTFLGSLVPKSKDAAEFMKKLNLEFFDSKGNMKGMADVAQELQDGIRGLSDFERLGALTKIFGRDAIRTASALADMGREGFNAMQAQIDMASATDNVTTRMKGLEGAQMRLKAAFVNFSVALGESGLLAAATNFLTFLTNALNKLAALDPQLLNTSMLIAGIAAVIGPAVVALGMFINGIAAITGVVTLASSAFLPFVGAIGAISGAALLLAGAFRDQLQPTIDRLKESFTNGAGADMVSAAFTILKDSVGELMRAFDTLANALLVVLEPFGGVATASDSAAVSFVAVAGAITNTLIQALTWLVDKIADAILYWSNWRTNVAETVDFIVEAVQRLYQGVKEWLVDKLRAAIDQVGQKVAWLGDQFRALFMAVVGGSYVPDMVTGIIKQGNLLDARFFQPVGKKINLLDTQFKDLANRSINSMSKEVEALTKRMNKMAVGSSSFRQLQKRVDHLQGGMQAAKDQLEAMGEVAGDLNQGAINSLFNRTIGFTDALIEGTKNWKDAFKDAIGDIAADLAKLIIRNQVSGLFNAVAGSSVGGIFSAIGGFLGFSQGGQPPVGRPSVVGENGPELLVPRGPTAVIPPDVMGALAGSFANVATGGPSIVVNQTFQSGMTRREFAQERERIKAETVQAVNEGYNRGGDYRRTLQR